MKDGDEYHVQDDRNAVRPQPGGAAPSAMLTPAAPAWLGKDSRVPWQAQTRLGVARVCWPERTMLQSLFGVNLRPRGYCGRHFRTDWRGAVTAGRRCPTGAKPF